MYSEELEIQIQKIWDSFNYIAFRYIDASSTVRQNALTKANSYRRQMIGISKQNLNQILEKNDINEAMKNYIEDINVNSRNINSYIKDIGKIIDSVKSWRMDESIIPWIKVYLGGVLIPISLFVAALSGSCWREWNHGEKPLTQKDLQQKLTPKIRKLR